MPTSSRRSASTWRSRRWRAWRSRWASPPCGGPRGRVAPRCRAAARGAGRSALRPRRVLVSGGDDDVATARVVADRHRALGHLDARPLARVLGQPARSPHGRGGRPPPRLEAPALVAAPEAADRAGPGAAGAGLARGEAAAGELEP